MKKELLRGIRTVIILLVLSGQWACQSDAPANSTTPASELSSGGDALDKTIQQAPDLNSLEQGIDQFQKKVKALRAEVNALPAATKKYATDFADLEAQLDGYLEKGGYVQDELRKISEAGNGESGTDLAGSKLEELQGGLNELNAAYKNLENAVKKLKTADGPVRLFEEGNR